MDTNELLKRMLLNITDMRRLAEKDDRVESFADAAHAIADDLEALHQHLNGGGTLPDAWRGDQVHADVPKVLVPETVAPYTVPDAAPAVLTAAAVPPPEPKTEPAAPSPPPAPPCLCGAKRTEPHAADCPFPSYQDDERPSEENIRVLLWDAAREELRKEKAARDEMEQRRRARKDKQAATASMSRFDAAMVLSRLRGEVTVDYDAAAKRVQEAVKIKLLAKCDFDLEIAHRAFETAADQRDEAAGQLRALEMAINALQGLVTVDQERAVYMDQAEADYLLTGLACIEPVDFSPDRAAALETKLRVTEPAPERDDDRGEREDE